MVKLVFVMLWTHHYLPYGATFPTGGGNYHIAWTNATQTEQGISVILSKSKNVSLTSRGALWGCEISVIPSKSKNVSLTSRGDLWGCETSRIPHCLHNWFTDGGEVVSLTHRPHFTPQKHYFFLHVLMSVRGWVNKKKRCSYPRNRLWRPIGLCDGWFTDRGDVGPKHRQRFTFQKHYFSASCNHLC
jgi:hypothetical protein